MRKTLRNSSKKSKENNPLYNIVKVAKPNKNHFTELKNTKQSSKKLFKQSNEQFISPKKSSKKKGIY